MHIDMASYEKIYDLKAKYELPERIFLDKGTSYSFSIFLTARGHSYQAEPGRGLWAGLEGAGPGYGWSVSRDWDRGPGLHPGSGASAGSVAAP